MLKTAVILMLTCCLAMVAAHAYPELTVDVATLTFADTIEGLSVAHTFVLTNTGDQDTVIASAAPSCACTRIVAELDAYRLFPGQSVALTARFDTVGSSGFVSKKLMVRSNAPGPDGDGVMELRFEGIVLAPMPYQSSVADLGSDIYLLVDVRDASAYAARHLIGALNVPLAEAAALATRLPPSAAIVIYDETGSSSALGEVARILHGAGVEDVYSLQGGFAQWQARYGAVRTVTGPDSTWGDFLDTSGVRLVSQSAQTTPYYAAQLLTDCVLLDLRAPEDYAAGHLAGAVNLAASDVAAYIAELKRETPIIVYSSDGATSDRVAYELWTQGRRATSLLGGFLEWTAQRGYDFVVASAR